LLQGKNIRLRVREKEDLPMLAEWFNNPDFVGDEYQPSPQRSRAEMEKMLEGVPLPPQVFIIEKNDGTKIGYVGCGKTTCPEIGFGLTPSERGKGYCTEAVKMIVDYIFLSNETVRIQAQTDVRNIASQKVLDKAGFKKEGIARKHVFVKGEWRDAYLYSILREEWKEPRMLSR
jgi:[ribosomal protein S5]-alanine N-acetyltransferase